MEEGIYYAAQRALEIIRYDLMGASANVVWSAQLIAMIGALMYYAWASYKGMLGEGKLISLAHFRPLAFFLMLMLYPSMMSFVDSLAMTVNNSLKPNYGVEGVRITDIIKTNDLDPTTDTDDNLITNAGLYQEEDPEAAQLANDAAQNADDASGDGEDNAWSLNVFANVPSAQEVSAWIGQKIYIGMMSVVEFLLFVMIKAIMMIINTLRVFFLVVLYTVGPIVIGVSLIPGFESTFRNWIAKYLSVHLWLGVGNIYEGIAVRLWQLFYENGMLSVSTAALGAADGQQIMVTTWSWVFLLCLIVGYMTIPTVSGWIIGASGIGHAGSLASAAAMKGAAIGGGAAVMSGSRSAARNIDRYRGRQRGQES